MSKVEMLTITQLIERGVTTLSKRRLAQLIKEGAITEVQVVGKTALVPLTRKNLKAIERQRKPKSPKRHNEQDVT